MRILVLNADYPRFLAWLYGRQPELKISPYAVQMAARNASLFGVADFYSRNFTTHGHVAAEIHVNNSWLQSAWAREHALAVAPVKQSAGMGRAIPGWVQRAVAPFKPRLRPMARKVGLSPKLDAAGEAVLLAQIENFKPDLVLNQDTFYVDTVLMRRIKQIGRPIVVGQVGIAPTHGEDWTVYDLMLSQLVATVEFFRREGVRSEVSHLAFEPDVLNVLPATTGQTFDVSFVGTVSADHKQRIALLEAVAARHDLALFGDAPHALPAASPLHRCFRGEVWGADMYQILRRSKITLNSHIDMTGPEAGNMRLFEATGVGTFLLTDFKVNLASLFDLDRDVVAWRSIEDCLAAIDRYLRDEPARVAIAAAGQAKTLSQHSYRHRTAEILGFLETAERPR
jgi:spore maturation protein CgeB